MVILTPWQFVHTVKLENVGTNAQSYEGDLVSSGPGVSKPTHYVGNFDADGDKTELGGEGVPADCVARFLWLSMAANPKKNQMKRES